MHDRWLRRARICGIAPLVAASVVSVGYAATRSNFWIWAAIATIIVGFVVVAVGLVFVAIYVWPLATSAPMADDPHGRPTVRRALFVALLLVSNLPAAAAFGYGGILLATRFTVSVINESNHLVDTFRVTGGGANFDLGPLRPGERRSGGFWVDRDDALKFETVTAGSRVCGVIDEYVTTNGGGDVIVRIDRDGTTMVRHRRRDEDDRPRLRPCS